MKIFEKVMYGFYLLSAGICLIDIIQNNDTSNIATFMWIFNAAMMFALYRYTDKDLDYQTEWRDKLIEELFKDKIDRVENSFKDIEIQKGNEDENI